MSRWTEAHKISWALVGALCKTAPHFDFANIRELLPVIGQLITHNSLVEPLVAIWGLGCLGKLHTWSSGHMIHGFMGSSQASRRA